MSPHHGGRRIDAYVDDVPRHTPARFDQSKAIQWRVWGRLASAFRELPLEPRRVLPSSSREQKRALSKGSPIHEARAASFDLLPVMDDRPRGIAHRCGPFFSDRARKIACPGRGRQRHSAGAGECARPQRLGQRSQRHRQRGQGACVTAADHHAGDATRRIPTCRLSPAAGAAGGEDQTNAICDGEIASPSGPSDRQGAGQAARRRDFKHLPGMLIPQASRSMDTTHRLAPILRDARNGALLQRQRRSRCAATTATLLRRDNGEAVARG